ncbi:MAG: DUF1016 domain-containing protein [Flavobacterium sp.]|nr:DUF1016 domain-containing protein [Flavobacterium sp.]
MIEQFQNIENEKDTIIQSMIGQFNSVESRNFQSMIGQLTTNSKEKSLAKENPSLFISKISFTHIIEFIKINDEIQRSFYEIQTIKNNWTVRQLQREINSMLYERVGLSTNKELLLDKLKKDTVSSFDEIIKSPYILEFLNIPERTSYSEKDLETSIINHLQEFLIEMGRGFCFEARQKEFHLTTSIIE